MGTGSSSKSSEQDNDVRDRLDSGDFQKVSPPSSPTFNAIMTVDEMSYSGILVENPDDSNSSEQQQQKGNSAVPSSEGATFAADLTTPPSSNRSKSRNKTNNNHNNNTVDQQSQPRRIVKATPPSKAVATAAEDNEASEASASVHHTAAPLSSPIGNNANAAKELLEESIEKNDPKTKTRERVTNRQKNDRERLFQEKRKQKNGTNEKPKVEANPFSRFLSAFSVNANPKHKRKEQSSTDAENKRLKYGFQDTSGNGNAAPIAAADKDSESSSKTDEADTAPVVESSSTKEEEAAPPSLFSPSWIAAASVATVAILLFAIVKGSKKK